MCVRRATPRSAHPTQNQYLSIRYLCTTVISTPIGSNCVKNDPISSKRRFHRSVLFFSPNSLDWFQQHRTANSEQQTAKSKTDEIPQCICTSLSHTQREWEGPRRYTNLSSLVNEFSNLKTMARAIDRDRKNGAWFADRFTYVCLLLMCVVHHSIHLTTFAQTSNPINEMWDF